MDQRPQKKTHAIYDIFDYWRKGEFSVNSPGFNSYPNEEKK